MSILWGILLLSILGFLLGLGLAFIAKLFEVKTDPAVEKILSVLPGLNCGACGFPGCSGYAEAIVKDDADIAECAPGGKDAVEKIGELLGKEAIIDERYVAKVFCLGDDAIAKKDYIFNGEEDCLTVYNYFQGDKSCKYGCVGKGNCIRVCPVGAIKRDYLNRVWVDPNECVGCRMCVSVCPTGVIKMVPINGGFFVACQSHYKGKIVKEICKKGCIGCKICEKITGNTDRIYVENNLAVIKYDNNVDLHTAAMKCPVDVIVPIKAQKSFILESKNKSSL